MPELPEVETIAKELRGKVLGETISELNLIWPGAFVNDEQLPVAGRRIGAISRKGKYILFRLDDGYLITHLRMTGQLIVKNDAADDLRHLRLIFRFISGKYMLFYDMRKFGRIYLTRRPEDVLKNTGIDAFDENFTVAYFSNLLKTRKAKLKSFLLNQKHIAGLGNIYIDEALFRAGIHPETDISDLSEAQRSSLYNAIRLTLQQAIQRMGTTISNYKTSGGGFGKNQNYLQVYGREGKYCLKCQTEITKIRHAGRGTHFCPNCQPMINSI